MKYKMVFVTLALAAVLLFGCASESESPEETPEAAAAASETPVPTSAQTPIVIDDSFQLEASDYFFRCADVSDALPEGTVREPWLLSDSSWRYHGFQFEYTDDAYNGRIFSMKNDSPNGVTLYGGTIGEPYTEFERALIEAGWKQSATMDDVHEYGIKMQGTCFLVDLTIGEDGTVEEWFLGNWPQGDYTQFFAQFDS